MTTINVFLIEETKQGAPDLLKTRLDTRIQLRHGAAVPEPADYEILIGGNKMAREASERNDNSSIESDEAVIGIENQAAARHITTAALVCFSLFLLAVIVSQVLRPDLGPAKNFLSEFAIDSFGFVMTAGFVVMGVGILLLATGLWWYKMTVLSGRFGVLLLGIAGIAMLGIAVFPTEVDPSLISQLHDLSALVHFIAVTIGALLVSFSFRHDSRLR